MDWPTSFVFLLNANACCFIQQPAAASALDQNQSVFLILEHGTMPHMEVFSKF